MPSSIQSQPIQVRITHQQGKQDDPNDLAFQQLVNNVRSYPSFEEKNNWITFEIKDNNDLLSFFSTDVFLTCIDNGVLKFTLKRKPPKLGAEFEEQLALLESKGFTRRGQNVRLLQKFDGDMDKVLEILEARKAQNHVHKFEEQLAALTERGFTHRGKNLGLLHRFDGDIEEVIRVLEKQGKKGTQFEEQLAILAERGFTKRGRNLGLLRRLGGDVEEVVKCLEKNGRIDWEEKEAQYSSELAQLEAMGFDRRPKNLRLLNRFDGSVEDVSRFLCNQQGKDKRNDEQECLEKYQIHLKVLNDLGYTNQKLNLRLLQRFGGDMKQVVPVLDKKGNNKKQQNKK
eukprot:CAMPEP_0174249974 /NCGR_PEP_ID=MMETSP0439-20130205/291_1 /TAXON_ID=0 /ORGANISM="Stereomyxa ramosa, Strain Chinc5" /LENGTH=341 /DNA_ID=CAMNT_0015329923 /DNA_START=39 /DNA_END=1064 /DNA_ORIENTATION=+